MLRWSAEGPMLTGLAVDMDQPAEKGAQRVVQIIVRRTQAGRAADGSPLPLPKSGGKPLARTGRTLANVRVLRVRKRVATVGVDGYGEDGRPSALALNAFQAGAAGGKRAGARPPVEIMNLSDAEALEVEDVGAADVEQQVVEAEAQGSALEHTTVTYEGTR